jgi:hypothetical protein
MYDTHKKHTRWINELVLLLNNKEYYISGSAVLTLTASLEDLTGWLNDTRPYDGAHKLSWESAIEDYHASLNQIGPKLEALTKVEARELTNLLKDMPKNLANRQLAITKAGILAKTLSSDQAIIASWQDLVDSCQDMSIKTNQLYLLRDQLYDIARAKSLDIKKFDGSGSLVSILQDQYIDIQLAIDDLAGVETQFNFTGDDFTKSYGMPLSDRLNLCEKLLTTSPTPRHNIVWLTIRNASLHRPSVQHGVVTLFDGKWLHGNLFAAPGHANRNSLPVELSNEDAFISKHDFKDEEHTLYARIDLGMGAGYTAVDKARSILGALIAYNLPKKNNWQIAGDYLLFRDGHFLASGHSSRHEIDAMYFPSYDSVSYNLEEMTTDGIVINHNIDLLLDEALNLRQQLIQSENGEPLIRIMNAVRALELTNSWTTRTSGNWHEYTHDLFRDQWSRFALLDLIDSIGNNAIDDPFGLPDERHERLRQIRSDIITPSQMKYTFDRGKLINHLPELQSLYQNQTKIRALNELSDILSDGNTVFSKLDELTHDYDLFLNRLRRYRNAAQHGGPTNRKSSDGLCIFAERIAHFALYRTINSILTGKDALVEMERVRDENALHFKNLQSGAPISNLFF